MAQDIRVTKIAEVENPKHPNNIPVGNSYDGFFAGHPVVGDRFSIGTFSTSPVQEVISFNKVRTLNSVYLITDLTQ